MCIQFTVFLCNLNSAPCMRYNAVSNYRITYGFFHGIPALAAQGRMGLHVLDSALHSAGFGGKGSKAPLENIARGK